MRKKIKRFKRILQFEVEAGKEYTVTKIIGIFTFRDSGNLFAQGRSLLDFASININDIEEQHVQSWEKLWEHRIEVSLSGLQQIINSVLYQFYSQLREDNSWSLGPTGLSGTGWEGRVFWDSDYWMFPPLLLLNPKLAKGFVEYRYNCIEGAKRNAVTENRDGILIPWQSAEFGDEMCRDRETGNQRHIVSCAVSAQWLYDLVSADDEYFQEKGSEIIIKCAKYWADRIEYNSDADRYEIKNVWCADEFSGLVDNNAYTNYGAVKSLQIASKVLCKKGLNVPEKWTEIIEKMYIPYDKDRQLFLEHDSYIGQKIKQADTVLLIYPLEMEMTDEQKKIMVDYYSTKYPDNKIMMSAAIDGIIYSELGDTRKSWKCLLDLLPHFRGDFLLTSESPSNECISFMTGQGGLLQLILMGFLGIRIHDDKLLVNPQLPEEIEWIKVKGLHYDGMCFDVDTDNIDENT